MKILKIKTLKHGWCDRSEIVLHAAFQCLVDFVDKELGEDKEFRPCEKSYQHEYYTVRRLYDWWTKERPSRVNPIDDPDLNHPEISEVINGDTYAKYPEWHRACRLHERLELIWEQEDNRMLRELCEIRYWLWT